MVCDIIINDVNSLLFHYFLHVSIETKFFCHELQNGFKTYM